MSPVPAPDPESGPPARPAVGRRRASAVPALSIGGLDDVRPGSLLVALPSLSDPTFAGTVVYVLDHPDTGTLGVVLGRPSQVEIRDVLPGLVRSRCRPGVFHVGGPCETDTALCLAVPPAWAPATANCGACPGTSTSSTSTATRPSSPRSSTGCASSPATRAGPLVSWPERSPRAPGPACPAGRTTSSVRGGAGPLALGHGPPDRPAGRALHGPRGPVCELRVPGSLRSGRKNPGEGGLGEEAALSAVFRRVTPNFAASGRVISEVRRLVAPPAGRAVAAVVGQRDRDVEVGAAAAASRTG